MRAWIVWLSFMMGRIVPGLWEGWDLWGYLAMRAWFSMATLASRFDGVRVGDCITCTPVRTGVAPLVRTPIRRLMGGGQNGAQSSRE